MKQTPLELVKAQLGVRPLARWLGINPSTIVRWRKSGLVPSKYHAEILTHPDCTLTANDLVLGSE